MIMIKIDMTRLRETLPENGTATISKTIVNGQSVMRIICKVQRPSLSEMEPMKWEDDFEMIKGWQREICGDAFSEFDVHTEGQHWTIWLKRVQLHFLNTNDDDIKAISGFSTEQLLAK